MSVYAGPEIVNNGLILSLDAANSRSYPGSGTTWFDLSGSNAHGTLNGAVSYVNDGPKSYFNFATQSDNNYISSTLSQNYLDMTIVFQPDFTLVAPSFPIVGLISTAPNASLADKSLRFRYDSGIGNWNLADQNPGDENDWAVISTTYYVNSQASNNLVSGWNIFGGYRTNQIDFPANFAYHLGSSGYYYRGFQGKIAAVYMYNRQLTAAEQTQNFNALRSRYSI